jgi:hypothetical protein
MEGALGRIFVSHGSENREQANELARYLEARGLSIWIAPRDVRPGVDYSEALQEAIEQCSAFLVLVTDKANKSPYVRVETELAFSLEKPIFPVRVGDVKPGPGLALFLKIRHWTDAFGPQREQSLERLAGELRAISGVAEPEADGRNEAAPPPPATAAEPAPLEPLSVPGQRPRLSPPAIAAIAGFALLLAAALFFLLRPASAPPPAPEPAPVAEPAPQPQPQPENEAQPADPSEEGEVFYTPPDPPPEQQEPPSDVEYDPPQ